MCNKVFKKPHFASMKAYRLYLNDLDKKSINCILSNNFSAHKHYNYKSISKHSINEIKEALKEKRIKSFKAERLFILGLKCSKCGLEGDHFEYGRDNKGKLHLDLYSEDGTILNIDHVLPISKGGERFNMFNMQTLCKICNDKKGDKIPSQFILKEDYGNDYVRLQNKIR